jgi:hypothetical protein
LWEKVFNNQEAAENAYRVFIDARTPKFHASGINKLVSRWQKHIDSNGFYSELRYVALKIKVENLH